MIRPRATNSYGNRAGGRARAKVTSHRARPRKAALPTTLHGRGKCSVCHDLQPLLADGKLRSHRMYYVPCLGSGLAPIES